MDLLPFVVSGVSSGATFGFLGVLLTIMARFVRIVNFSQVAVAVFGVYAALRLVPPALQPWGTVALGMLVAGALSALVGWIIARWLGDAGISARSATTVAFLLLLLSAAFLVFGTRPQPMRPPFLGPLAIVGNVPISLSGTVMLVAGIVVAGSVSLLLRRTRYGTRLAAIADRQQTAELMGINVVALQLTVWAITGALGGFAIAVAGSTQATDSSAMVSVLIPAAAAALVGRFERMDLALLGGLLLGAVQGVLGAHPSLILLKDWIPIVVIIVFLLWNQRKEVWDVAR